MEDLFVELSNKATSERYGHAYTGIGVLFRYAAARTILNSNTNQYS